MTSINPSSSAVAAGSTRVQVVNDTTAPVAKEDGRATYEIYNAGPDVCYLGGADVTAANGQPLPPLSARTIAIRLGGKLWAVCASEGTADLRVLRIP